MRVNWLKSASEPSLDEILSDPITQALMRSDGLDADQVRLVAIAARRKVFTRSGAFLRHAGAPRRSCAW